MKLIGRRDELERIVHVASAPREGALLILGEPGSGKSWLLEQAQAGSPVRSILTRALPTEKSWRLSGLARVFAFVSEVDVTSPRTASWRDRAPQTTPAPLGAGYGTHQFDDGVPDGGTLRAITAPPALTVAGDIRDGSDRFAAARELLSALRTPMTDPLLLLIDDIDQMDEESQLLLGYMAEGLAGTGVRIVAAATSIAPSSPLAAFRRIGLGSLSTSESRALAAVALGSDGDPGVARILADTSAGSPATIVRAAQALSSGQRQGREPLTLPLRPPESSDRLAAQRLGHADARELRLLEYVSLAACAHTAALLDAIGMSDPGQSAGEASSITDADRLDDLEYAGLVIRHGHSVRIADPRVRSWLYWNMGPGARRERHRLMAAAHHGVDARMEHWHQSFAEYSRELVDAVLAAANQCATSSDRAAAVEFAERALRLAASAADHQVRLRELATTFLVHSDLGLAARYARWAATETGSPQAAVDVATLRIAIEYARTHVVPTHDIDAVVGLYSANGMAEVANLMSLAAACHAERWETEEARRQLVPGEAQLTQSDRAVRDGVSGLVDALEGVPIGAAQSPSEVASAGDVPAAALAEMPVHSLLLLGTTLSYREHYARARHIFALVTTQPTMNTPLWLELARYHLAVNEIRSGRYHSARLAVEEWMASAPPATARTSSRMYLRAWYLQSTGNSAEANALFAECMDRTLAERTPAVAANILATQGGAALAANDFSEATRLLELAEVIGGRFANPALLRSSIDLIEVYVSTNRLREARGVLAGLEVAQTSSPSRWLTLAVARGRGLTAADDRSLALYQRALELYTSEDSPFERGRTLTNLAAAQARLGFVRESEKSLAAAHNAFGNAGSSSWAHRVRHGGITDPEPGTAAAGILTEEEQLIVEKVREGYRNKEIAAELYISLRTVELRLTHIYRKVGARSRSHLAALLN
ncbi:regulatory LuxR family protein [Glaciihabitans tibetensis]|uniref:Regulatory LuxR family protein n=1 Tax=Glaciihabitans tibetensis TaxID=1266600 RepID=A0A2T0V9U6_9MICO|nr:LuxR family transcriptional regulator [Glaciihabitans tibetensis]PRY66960.1 regulatory LuxR family protein [Glaciihabitans tibetensis]